MAGMAEWKVQVDSNIAKLLGDSKELREQLEQLKNGKYDIKLNIDEKKLDNVIANLDKMLSSLGKGTGDFKQFENLAKELTAVTSEVKDLSAAFGKIDGNSGAKSLLSCIQSIDSSLTELTKHITEVGTGFGNIGKNVNTGQIQNAQKATEGLAAATEKVVEAQSKLGNKTNLSLGDGNVEQAEQYAQISQTTVSVLSDIGKTEEQIVAKMQQERLEAEANNEALKEHLVLLDKEGKVVANHVGNSTTVNGTFTDEQLAQASGGKIIHSHPGKSSFFGKSDLKNLFTNSMYEQIKEVELLWGDSSLLVDKSSLTKQSSELLQNIMSNVRTTLTQLYDDTQTGNPSQSVKEQINAIEKEIFKSISQKLNVSVTENGTMSQEVVNGLSDFDKAIIQKFQEIETSALNNINVSDIISSISQNPIKDVFQGDTSSTGNFDELETKIKAIFTDSKELESVLQSLREGTKFDFSMTNNGDGVEQFRQLKEVLKEYGYTIKEVEENTEALNYSGVITSISTVANEAPAAANAMEQLAESTEKTANALKQFKNAPRLTMSDYLERADEYSSTINKYLENRGQILGGSASTSLTEDGLVRVTADIKNLDGTWSRFTAKMDADLNILSGKGSGTFKTITNNVEKLDEALDNYNKEQAPNLSLGEIEEQVKKIKESLNLSDSFNVKVDERGIVTISETLKETSDTAKTTAQTFASMQDAIDNWGDVASNAAEKTSVSMKAIKEATSASASSSNNDSVINVETLNEALNKTTSIIQGLSKMPELATQFSDVENKVNALNEQLKNGEISVKDYNNQVNSLTSEYSKLVNIQQKRDVETYKANAKAAKEEAKAVKDLTEQLQKYESKPALENQNTNYKNQTAELRNYVEQLQNLLKTPVAEHNEEWTKSYNDLMSGAQKASSELSNMANTLKGSTQLSRENVIHKIAEYLEKNTRITKESRQQLEAYIKELQTLGSNANPSEIYTQFMNIVNAEKLAGNEGKRLRDIFKDKALYNNVSSIVSMYFSWYQVINKVGEAINTVRELDTAFTEMKKVSDESVSSLKAYQKESFNTADEIGTTALDLQDATANFMRLGESLDEAAESSKDATILMNVSEFESIDDATESLIAMSQAYDDLDKMDIINKLNQVGNNYSISTDEAASALQKSASALKTANNNMDEALALVTAGELSIAWIYRNICQRIYLTAGTSLELYTTI